MNFIAIIILVTFIIEFFIQFIADYLNLKMINPNLPDKFKDLYDPETYKKSQAYLKINTKFGWITSTLDLIIILSFWFGKGFPFIDNYVRSFGFGTIITGLLFIGVLILAKSILLLPFSIYSTFVIEERFNFNNTTILTFITDLIKSLILIIIIGGLVISGILFFLGNTGKNAWLYCWTGTTVFILFLQYIIPTWVMPLFNKFIPIEDGELKNKIMNYAKSIKFPLKNIFYIDGSKRSSKSNAFFTGFGNNKRIVLYDTLIEKHEHDEILSILAHEMGHYKKKHIQMMMFISIIQTGVIFFLLSFFISYKELFNAFYMNNTSIYAGLIFFGMLFSPISFFLGIAMQIFSRRNEYKADKFAVKTTQNEQSMENALIKLSINNLSNLYPHPFYVFLNYSHPPIIKRLEALSTK